VTEQQELFLLIIGTKVKVYTHASKCKNDKLKNKLKSQGKLEGILKFFNLTLAQGILQTSYVSFPGKFPL
jgi:hypothetical protein